MTGADAASADLNSFHTAVAYCSYLLKVGVPHGTGFVVSMANVVAKAWAFTASFTFSRHMFIPPLITEKNSIPVLGSRCK